MAVASIEEKISSKGGRVNKFLTFRLANHSYGISVLQIKEIIRVMEMVPLPQMPPYIKGVINLRGRVIPVVDLRIKFSMDVAAEDDRTCIIVVQVTSRSGRRTLVGLLVNAVEEVVSLGDDDLEPAPEFGSNLDASCIEGLAKVKGDVKTILNIDRVVQVDTLEKIESASANL